MKILNKKEVKLFFTFFIVYLAFINVWDWNDLSIIDFSLAMAYKGELYIDDLIEVPNLNIGNKAYYNGHYYSDKAPGLPFLTYPIKI